MIDKNLLRFLQFRDKILDTTPLEQKYGITLPPIYQSFVSVFSPNFAHIKIKREDRERFQSFIIPLYSTLDKTEYTDADDELALESFMEPEQAMTHLRSNSAHLVDYLVIANHGYAGGLLVGIGEHNKDQIFHNTDSEIITYMANNIFELLHNFQLVQYDFEKPPVQQSKLYKNWGEDFWRIRE